MSDFLQELRERVLADMCMPAARFFTPRARFWNLLHELVKEHPNLVFLDCGTGMGDLPREAGERGLRMLGVDHVDREGQDQKVLRMDARFCRFGPLVWPLMCRPSHEGWAYEVAKAGLAAGATVLYAGKPENVSRDIPSGYTSLGRNVGAEGESLYQLRRAT